jgi:hypothetical protein
MDLTYASVRVDATRERVGQVVERDARQNFLSSVSDRAVKGHRGA